MEIHPIKAKRQNIGMSQIELGRRLGVHRQSIADWETGRYTPSGPNLVKLSEILDCPVGDLLVRRKVNES